MFAVNNGNLEIVESLLQEDVIDVNLQNNNEETALMIAAYTANIVILNRLLEIDNIVVNLKNEEGDTALMVAQIEDEEGSHQEIIEILQELEEEEDVI